MLCKIWHKAVHGGFCANGLICPKFICLISYTFWRTRRQVTLFNGFLRSMAQTMALMQGSTFSILHSDKDQQILVVCSPKICPINPKWRTAAVLNKALLSQRAQRLSVEILQLQNIAIMWHYLCDLTFTHFYTIPKCDSHTHTDRRTDRYTTTACTVLSIASRGKNTILHYTQSIITRQWASVDSKFVGRPRNIGYWHIFER